MSLVYPLPARAPQARYVNKAGSDTSGDGSIGNPFLTVQAALSSIADASNSNPYAIFVGPGNYTLNASQPLNPYISIIGSGRKNTVLSTPSGSVTLTMTSAHTGAATIEISNLTLLNSLVITRNAGTPSAIHEYWFTEFRTFGNITATGSGDLRLVDFTQTNGDILFFVNSDISGTFTSNGMNARFQSSVGSNTTFSDTGSDASNQQLVCFVSNSRVNFLTLSGSVAMRAFASRVNRYVLNGTTVSMISDVTSFPSITTLNSSATLAQIAVSNPAEAFNIVTGTSAAPSLINAGTAITTNTTTLLQEQYIAGSGGSVVMSANPQLAAGNKEGQLRILFGTHATNTVTLNDGNGLSLGAATRVLGLNSSLMLAWDSAGAKWIEVAYKA